MRSTLHRLRAFQGHRAAALIMALGLATASPLFAQEGADATGAVPVAASPVETGRSQRDPRAEERAAAMRARLDKTDAAIAFRRGLLSGLKDAVPGEGAARDYPTADDVSARVAKLREEIAGLRRTFEQLATGGADVSVFSRQAPETFDWQAEVVEISKPIFDELRGLTEKPRQMERLRREIAGARERLVVAQRAISAIVDVDEATLDASARTRLERLQAEWEQRRDDIRQIVDLAQLKLTNLEDTTQTFGESAKDGLVSFARGRGLTLLVAIGAALVAWALMRLVLKGIENRARRARRDDTRTLGIGYRLMLYAHRVVTIVAITIAVLVTFSVMGDFLLLTLGIIAVFFALAGLRKVLPGFLSEAKLLVGVGPVREGERIVYEGLPYEVKTINVYSILRNPRLEGVVRVPLKDLTAMVSRPGREEPWFPSEKGDWVIAGDAFGEVLRQTREYVQMSVLGGMRHYVPSTDYAGAGVRNLSEGPTFVVTSVFGIDYAHQDISQSEVSPRFRDALEAALRAGPFAEHFDRVAVDFKTAGANSLDYQLIVWMRSGAAASYYAIERRMQQVCVDVCNREGWGIPFAQMVLHQGSGFDRPSA